MRGLKGRYIATPGMIAPTAAQISSPTQILNDVVPVAESVVTGSAAASLSLTLANGPYRDLFFALLIRSTGVGGAANLNMNLNNDSDADYDYIRSDNGVPTLVQAAKTSVRVASAVPAAKPVSIFGRIVHGDYSVAGTAARFAWEGSFDAGASFVGVNGHGRYAAGTNPISSIKFTLDSGVFAYAELFAWGVQ